jgi:cyclopropane fatty-acyl-phospholipid synthase-like methyltransferase
LHQIGRTARARAAAGGLAQRVDIRLADDRDLAGAGDFDKAVSVGMYEHVGARNWPVFFPAENWRACRACSSKSPAAAWR